MKTTARTIRETCHPAAGGRQSAPAEAYEPWLRRFPPQGKSGTMPELSVKEDCRRLGGGKSLVATENGRREKWCSVADRGPFSNAPRAFANPAPRHPWMHRQDRSPHHTETPKNKAHCHPAAGGRQLAPAGACEPWLRRVPPQGKSGRKPGLSVKTASRRQEAANQHQREPANLGFAGFRPTESRAGSPSFP